MTNRKLDLYSVDDPLPVAPRADTPAPSRPLDLYEGVDVTPGPAPKWEAPAGVPSWVAHVWADFPTIIRERYEARAVIGEGGMGVVVEAHDRRLDRLVAIKGPKDPAGQSEESRERQRHEARIGAHLTHPTILPIYDVWIDARGHTWSSMLRVPGTGPTLSRLLTELGSSCRGVEERPLGRLLPLMQTIGQAVAYAHRMGIVHRDLKPDNIFIDSTGAALVGDWGVATELEASRIRTNDLVGTPGYAAPEQLGVFGAPRADERSDVFSLGTILFELVVGRRPGDPRTIVASGKSGKGLSRVRSPAWPWTPSDAAAAADPSRTAPAPGAQAGASPWQGLAAPTEVLAKVAVEPLEIPERVPRDLAAIIRRATAFDPGARYENVEALNRDLFTYQNGGLLEGLCYTTRERATRWARANPAVAVALLGALVLGLVIATAGLKLQRKHRKLNETLTKVRFLMAQVHAEKAAAALLRKDVDQAIHHAAISLASCPTAMQFHTDRPLELLSASPPRGPHLSSSTLGATPTCLAWLSNGSEVVIGDDQGRLHRYDPSGRVVSAPHAVAADSGAIQCLSVLPGDDLMAVATADGSVRVVAVRSRRVLGSTRAGPGGLTSMTTFEEPKRLVGAGRNRGLWAWDLPGLEPRPWKLLLDPTRPAGLTTPVLDVQAGPSQSLAWSPGPPNLFVAHGDGTMQMLAEGTDMERGAFIEDPRPIRCLSAGVVTEGEQNFKYMVWARDGAETRCSLRVWKLSNWTAGGTYAAGSPITCVSGGQSSRLVVVGTEEGAVHVIDVTTTQRHLVSTVHGLPVVAVGLSPDARKVASVDRGGIFQLTDVESIRPDGVRVARGPAVRSLEFSEDGRRLTVHRVELSGTPSALLTIPIPTRSTDACVASSPSVVVQAAAATPTESISRRPGADAPVVRSLTGRLEARAQGTRVILTGPAAGGRFALDMGEGNTVTAVGVGPGDDLIIAGSQTGLLRLWRAGEEGAWATFANVRGHGEAIEAIATSPDGQWMASGCAGGRVCLWRTEPFMAPDRWCESVVDASPFVLDEINLVGRASPAGAAVVARRAGTATRPPEGH